MARLRISGPASAVLASILATSLERGGEAGRARYSALLVAAMRRVARAPDAAVTRDRADVLPGIRSFHVKHARRGHAVRDPVHVIFFRVTDSHVEIVRVLHERMEPTLHVTTASRDRKRRGRRGSHRS